MRRTITLMAALLALLLTAIPLAAQEELPPGGTFVDDDGNPHEANIEALVAAGITEGCAPERYCPTDPVTRGQMASFLARALEGELTPTDQDFFTDDEGNPHEANINLIAANEIAEGYGNQMFGPQDSVTRGQMAAFLARALEGLTPTDQDFFTDDDGSPFEQDINLLAANDIVRGFDDTTYGPETNITRAQMATMLVRALGLTPIQPPARPLEAAVYLFMASLDEGEGPFLAPISRQVDREAPAEPLMQMLLEGPTTEESAATPALMSEIPTGTTLLSIVVENGVATVDLSSEFESGGGSFSMLGRVAQVVFTLTQFPTVDEVDFEIDGQPVTTLGGEGVILSGYDTREELLSNAPDFFPPIFVDQPSYGGEAENPMRIQGWTRVFEKQFEVEIVDNDGLILTEEAVLAQGEELPVPTEYAGPSWTAFDVTIPYEVTQSQLGALIVSDTSAQTGERVNVREYPVFLVPSG